MLIQNSILYSNSVCYRQYTYHHMTTSPATTNRPTVTKHHHVVIVPCRHIWREVEVVVGK